MVSVQPESFVDPMAISKARPRSPCLSSMGAEFALLVDPDRVRCWFDLKHAEGVGVVA
jgi:hypothetical protein